MTIDTADRAALLQNGEFESKESFESGDDFQTGANGRSNRGMSWAPSRSVLLAHVGVLLLYTATFLAALTYVLSSRVEKADVPLSREDLRTTPMRDALRYDIRTVGYNFEDVNPFKGRPVPQIDEEWSYVLNGAHEVRVREDEMAQSNLSSIRLADGSEDYIVQPIAYHMLHCLYNIYKYAHPDFYGNDPSGPDWIVTHTDHCVDNLRQFVQCHAGTGVSTFKWLDSRKIPYPVLNTEETCIDWDHYDGWVRDHSVALEDVQTLKNGHLLAHPTFGPIYPEDYLSKHDEVKGHDGHL